MNAEENRDKIFQLSLSKTNFFTRYPIDPKFCRPPPMGYEWKVRTGLNRRKLKDEVHNYPFYNCYLIKKRQGLEDRMFIQDLLKKIDVYDEENIKFLSDLKYRIEYHMKKKYGSYETLREFLRENEECQRDSKKEDNLSEELPESIDLIEF